MPQTKTTKKKATGKTSSVKVGGGGVGTRVSKLNLKIVIPIVVLVAALGGFYIFRKSSAAGRTFTISASSMQGGKYVAKNGIPSYREVTSNTGRQSTHASINNAQSNASTSFCVRYSGSGAANVLLNYYPYWGAPHLTYEMGKIPKETQKVYTERTTCVLKPSGKSIVSVQIISTDGTTRVIEVYGE